jgi:ADP-heptose:LPS heptosyltransferase
MGQLYVWLYGGYGDCIVAYIHGGLGFDNKVLPSKCGKGSKYWDKIKSIKTLHPDISIRAIVMSGNPTTAKLAIRNPYIDEVIQLPTLNGVNTASNKVRAHVLKHISGHIDIDYFIDSSPNKKQYKSAKNQVFLNNIEEEELNKIKQLTNKKYIVIHPFASKKTRRPVKPIDYVKLAEELYKQTGYKSIVVGGSFDKTRRLSSDQFLSDKILEDFPYKSNSIINLVNKSSMLLDTQLVLNSKAVVGTWSCHTTTSLSIAKPTVIYTTQKAFSYFKKITTKKFKRGLQVNKTFLTNEITDDILKETIKYIKDKI